jgi:translation elongation factor EF-Tu-like GTPase
MNKVDQVDDELLELAGMEIRTCCQSTTTTATTFQ